MVGKVLRGLLAAGMLLGAGTATAADKYAIQEHQLAPADSFSPPSELTSGDITTNSDHDEDMTFIDEHAKEAQKWTAPSLGQELFPRLSAGTLVTGTHDRQYGSNDFMERVDLDLYWLQVRLPVIQSQGTQTLHPDVANLDLLLPVGLDDNNRLGVLIGTDLGLDHGGLYGQRYQLMYGLSAGMLDVQLRGGYGLESSPNAANGLPEFATASSSANREAELLYGAMVGARWAKWGRLAIEGSGAHLTETHADLFTIAPGIRLNAGDRGAAEIGLSALLDFTRSSTSSLDMRGAGGMASLRYNFL